MSDVVDCESYVYDLSTFTQTLATKLDLVCSSESNRNFLGTLMMLGLLVGSFFGGLACDRFGRKKTMFAATAILGPTVLANAFVHNYVTYAVLHLVYCACIPVLWLSAHTLTLEMFGSSYKKVLLCTKCLMWTCCPLGMVLLAYLVRDWRYQHVTIGSMAILTLLIWPLVPESPRWMAQNGRSDDAKKLLLKIADSNKKNLDENDISVIDVLLARVKTNATLREEKKTSLLELFKPHFLLTSLILISSWIMANVGFYTLSLNAGRLHGDLFVNYALTFGANMMMAPFLWLTVGKCGRKLILVVTQATVGVCCIVLAFVPKDLTIVVLVFFVVGNFACNLAFNLCWFLSPDFYPTNLRSQATGVSSTIARMFGLVAPFIANLGVYWQPLPMLILGLPFIVLSVMIALFLPEITDKQFPQSTEEAIQLHKRKS
jgi:OCT family organic cation transporter-like MFS transporter 4/5